MTDAAERWAYVPGFEYWYAVSTLGRVWSYGSRKLLKPGRMSGGHWSVALGRGNTRCVHELILTAFVGPRPPGMVSRHLDGDHDNNQLSNLEWATYSRNALDKKWHKGARTYKLTGDDVLAVKALILRGFTNREIADLYEVNIITARRIRNGESHKDV